MRAGDDGSVRVAEVVHQVVGAVGDAQVVEAGHILRVAFRGAGILAMTGRVVGVGAVVVIMGRVGSASGCWRGKEVL